MGIMLPGESPEYRAARDRLLEREIDVRRAMEVAKAPLPHVLAFGRERGWRRLRLLSSAGNSYNVDYFARTPDGIQRPMLTVFRCDGDVIRHFWSSELFYAPPDPGQEPRHVGTLEPLWNLFDLTPEGRPLDWVEQFSYE